MSVRITHSNAHGTFPVNEPHQMEIGPRNICCIYRTEKYLETPEFKSNPNSFLADIDFDKLIIFHFEELYDSRYLVLNNFDTNIIIQLTPQTQDYLITLSDEFKKAKLQPVDLGDDDHFANILNLDKTNFNFEEINHLVKSSTDALKQFSQPFYESDEGMTYSSFMNLSLTTIAMAFYCEVEELEKTEFIPNRTKYFEIYPGFSTKCVYTNTNQLLKDTILNDAEFNPKTAFHFTENGHFICSCSNYTILLEYPKTEQLNDVLYHLQNCQLFPVTPEDEDILISKYIVDMTHFPSHEEQEHLREELESLCQTHFPNSLPEPRISIMINERYLALTYKTVLAYNVFSGNFQSPPAEQQRSLASLASSTFALLNENKEENKEECENSDELKSLVKNNFNVDLPIPTNQIIDIEVLPGFTLTCLYSTSNNDVFRQFLQELGCDQITTVHFIPNEANEIFIGFCTVNHLLLLPKTSSLVQVNKVLFQIQNSQVYCIEEEDRSQLFQYYNFDILREFASAEQIQNLLELMNSKGNNDFEGEAYEFKEVNGELTYSGFFYLTKQVMKAYYDLITFSASEIDHLSEEPGSSEEPGPSEEHEFQDEGGDLNKVLDASASLLNKPIQPRTGVQPPAPKEHEITSDTCERIDSCEWRDYNYTNREITIKNSDFDIHDKFEFNEVADIKIDQNDGCGFIRCVLSTTEAPELANYARIIRPGKVATINFSTSPNGTVKFFSLCTGRDLIGVVNPSAEHINSIARDLNYSFVIPCKSVDFDILQSYENLQPFKRIASRDLVQDFEQKLDEEIERRGVSYEYDNPSTYSKFMNVTYRAYLGFLLSSRQDECEKLPQINDPDRQYSYVRTPASLYDPKFNLYQELNVNTVSEIELAPHCFVNCVISAAEDIVFDRYLSDIKIRHAVSIHFSSSPNRHLRYFTFCTGRDLVVVLNPTQPQMNQIIRKISSSKCHVIPCSLSDRSQFFFYDFLNKVSDAKIIPQRELPNVVEEINKCASSLYPRGFNHEIPMSYEKFLYIAYKTFVGFYVRGSYMRHIEPAWFYPLPSYKNHNFIVLRELTPTESLSINKENGRLYVIKEFNDEEDYKQALCIFANKKQRSSLVAPCYGSLRSKKCVDKKLAFAFGSRGTLREVLENNYLDIDTKKRITIELVYALAYLHMNGHYPCNISIDNVAISWTNNAMLTNFYEYPNVQGVSPEGHDVKCLGDIIYTLATGNDSNEENREAISPLLGFISRIYDLTQIEGTTACDLVSAILSSNTKPNEKKLIGRLTDELPQRYHRLHVFPPPPHCGPPGPPPPDAPFGMFDKIGAQLLNGQAPPPGPPPPEGVPPPGPPPEGVPPPGPHEPEAPGVLPAPPPFFPGSHGPHKPFHGQPPFLGPPFHLPPPGMRCPCRGFCPFAGPKPGMTRYFKFDCSVNDGQLDSQTLNQLKVLRVGEKTAFHFVVNESSEETEDRTYIQCSNNECITLEHATPKALNTIIPKMEKTQVIPICDEDLDKLFEYYTFDLLLNICRQPELDKVRSKGEEIAGKFCDFEDKELTSSTIATSLAVSEPPPPPPAPRGGQEDLSYQNVTGVDNDMDIKKRFKNYMKAAERDNNPAALYNLGLMYSRGAGNVVEQDKQKAAEFYERAAEQGNDKAQFNLALLYAKGEGVPQDKAKAAELYEKAAEQGNPKAQSNLGLMYARGDGVEQNYERAIELFNEAAEQDDAEAQFNLGLLYNNGQGVPENKEKAIELFRQAADKGNNKAQFNLGVMYHNGVEDLLPKDDEKAAEFYSMAAAKGNPEAQFNLGVIYSKGVPDKIPQDKEKAAQLFQLAAEQGDVDALLNLGTMYSKGEGVEKNKEKTVELYEQAAAKNNPKAQFNLGVMYSKGDGVEQDKEKAAEYYEQAANQNVQQAKFNLGVMCFKGDGIPQDKEKAAELFEQSANDGNSKAAFNLAVMYQKGDGVDQNTTKAVELYEKAAKKNNKDALLNLGAIYNDGLDEIDEDVDKAVDYFQRAADLGSTKAQLILGQMYLHGDQINEDLDKAENLLQQASQHNCDEAFLHLGDLYAKQGDDEKAQRFYRRAAEAGVPGAEDKLNQSNPDQIQTLYDSLEERIKVLRNVTNNDNDDNDDNIISRSLGGVTDFLLIPQEHSTKKGLSECIATYKNANSMMKEVEDEVDNYIKNEQSKLSNQIEEEEEVHSSQSASRSKLPSLGTNRSRNASAVSSSTNVNVSEDEELATLRRQVQTLQSQLDTINQQIELETHYSSGAQASASAQMSSGSARNDANFNRLTPTSPRRKQQPILSPRDPDTPSPRRNGATSPRALRNKIRTLQKKADENDVDSICSLAACYMLGEGVDKDITKAFELYLKAAELGSPDALYQTGVCYSYGKGTDVDKEKGFEYYLRSAELNNPKAQFAVGHFYEYGNEEFQSDHELAKKWYRKAAEQGHDGARRALENCPSEAALVEINSDEQ